MAKPHGPKRGSHGYSPRKRAKSPVPHIKSWPELSEGPKIQGFAGYKAGMTHVFMKDYRKKSTTAGQEVMAAVTVVEVPPMKVAAFRLYAREPYGLRSLGEVWTKKLDKDLAKRLPIPKNVKKPSEVLKKVNMDEVEDVRLIVHTQPKKVTGVPKKVPEIMEFRVSGGTMEERVEYAKKLLGKEIDISDFVQPGKMVDVISITKGKGWQSAVKRWGVKVLSHKNSKKRRKAANTGPKRPGYIKPTVPQAGQTGYHHRTEYNKRILIIGDNPDDINPKGGFLHYGLVRNKYVVIHGSIPGPTKRLVKMRDVTRFRGEDVAPEIAYISRESKQGV